MIKEPEESFIWNVPTTSNKENLNPATSLASRVHLTLDNDIDGLPIRCNFMRRTRQELGLLYMFKWIRRFGIGSYEGEKSFSIFIAWEYRGYDRGIWGWRLEEEMDIAEISPCFLRAIIYLTDLFDRLLHASRCFEYARLQISCYSFPVVFVLLFAKRRPRTPINRGGRLIIEISAWFSSSQPLVGYYPYKNSNHKFGLSILIHCRQLFSVSFAQLYPYEEADNGYKSGHLCQKIASWAVRKTVRIIIPSGFALRGLEDKADWNDSFIWINSLWKKKWHYRMKESLLDSRGLWQCLVIFERNIVGYTINVLFLISLASLSWNRNISFALY